MSGWEPSSRARSDEDAPSGVLERVLAANRAAAARHPEGGLPRTPARGLAIVTCMDARIDTLRICGLQPGDAHVIRIAGAAVGDVVLESLRVSRDLMNTREALIIGHSDCAGHASDDDARAAVRRDVERLSAEMGAGYSVHGLFFDVRTGRLDLA
jgi:carbonic anhydrase